MGGDMAEIKSPDPLLVREKQLPALLGISRNSIRRAMEAGRFPRCVRIGHCIAWRRVDLERWIADGCGAVEDNN